MTNEVEMTCALSVESVFSRNRIVATISKLPIIKMTFQRKMLCHISKEHHSEDMCHEYHILYFQILDDGYDLTHTHTHASGEKCDLWSSLQYR